jgi:hypothetical protein
MPFAAPRFNVKPAHQSKRNLPATFMAGRF